jgi:toxin ParE1/3/4
MKRLGWAEPALNDLSLIADYISDRDPAAATTVVEAIRQSVRRLQMFPESGPIAGSGAFRKISVPQYRYIVYYEFTGDVVIILRVRHAAEHWRP